MPKPLRTDSNHRVGVIIALVLADLRRNWTVAQMAEVLGISNSHLRRMFAGQVGTSPKRLLADIRLQVAADLLDDPAIRLKEIIGRVGVSDPSHFCRDFRQRFGVSPSQFRALRVDQRTILPIKERIGLLTERRDGAQHVPTN